MITLIFANLRAKLQKKYETRIHYYKLIIIFAAEINV